MGKERPWQDEERLYRLYVENDMYLAEVADALGCGESTVGRWCGKYNISKEEDKLWTDPALLEELYWDKDLSVHEIGERLGCCGTTVSKWMERLDIDRRTPAADKQGPWQDGQTLHNLYHNEGLTTHEIADRLGCAQRTVWVWMDRHGIETKSREEVAPENAKAVRVERASFRTSKDGYERWTQRVGQETYSVGVHRIVAAAEHGFDAVGDRVVHHKNQIPWDNRPENLAVLSDSDHKQLHKSEKYDPHTAESV